MPFNKPDITQLSALGSSLGDVYFPQTKLLLPFDGVNGATTTSDLSNSTLPVSFVGTAQISTAQSKIGNSSLLVDGNSDYLTFDLPTLSSTFTIEFWFRGITLSGNMSIITNYGGSNGWWLQYTGSYLKAGLGGGSPHITGSTTLSTDTWYHVALSGSAGSYKLFLNGTQEGSTYTGSTLLAGRSEASIGALYSGGYTSFYHGYVDNVRITSGIARYTSNFTPPTTAYLTSAGDVNKQILINSTADGVAIGTGGINQTRIAKAWVNWNGTGTVAIRDSYNVSSVSDRATGKYTVNFSTAMSDTNYSGAGNAGFNTTNGGADNFNRCLHFIPYTTSAAYANSFIGDASSPSLSDCHVCTLLVFGN